MTDNFGSVLNNTIQTTITIACLGVAVAYALWRVYSALSSHDNPCTGCEKCCLKQEIRTKEACDKKK